MYIILSVWIPFNSMCLLSAYFSEVAFLLSGIHHTTPQHSELNSIYSAPNIVENLPYIEENFSHWSYSTQLWKHSNKVEQADIYCVSNIVIQYTHCLYWMNANQQKKYQHSLRYLTQLPSLKIGNAFVYIGFPYNVLL